VLAKSYGETVAEWRRTCGLTQAELAELVGVDVSTIHRWETGRRVPTARSRSKLVAVLQALLAARMHTENRAGAISTRFRREDVDDALR
jgi:transcriptional regulator with XRE-family HTH domain